MQGVKTQYVPFQYSRHPAPNHPALLPSFGWIHRHISITTTQAQAISTRITTTHMTNQPIAMSQSYLPGITSPILVFVGGGDGGRGREGGSCEGCGGAISSGMVGVGGGGRVAPGHVT